MCVCVCVCVKSWLSCIRIRTCASVTSSSCVWAQSSSVSVLGFQRCSAATNEPLWLNSLCSGT